jgi:hypothetical protein
MLAAVPFKLATADATAWQICDIASDPEFRQRGLFARCLELVREAAADDVMFCFPNARSRRGLDKAGYSVVSRMRLQVRPIFALPFAGTGPAPAHSTNLPACEAAFQTCPVHRRFIQRSPEFLHWRYAAHPLNRYVCVAASGTGPSTSCVIVRHLTVLRMRLGIVVDGCSGSDEDARAGHAAARGWAKESGCSALVWARDLAMQSPSGTVMGNLERPWHVTCFARAVDGARFGGPAQMQLGDWDAV